MRKEAPLPHFDKHIFICTNERDPGNPRGDCKSKGSEAIRNFLKTELGKRGLKDRMRANASGCLDQCERGIAVVVYPEQTWYQLRTVEDAREVLEQHLVGGTPVAHLVMKPKP
ncbi:MAG: (2Fe-2S) ferredoxin domain-containing protein [Polyangia bacterium]